MPIHEHQRLQSKVQRLGLLAKHGEPYHQAMISMPSSSRPSGHLPHKHNRVVSGLDLEPISYEPATYAVRMAGKIQGNADWSVPRVLRNVLPSGTARILKAKAMAKVDVLTHSDQMGGRERDKICLTLPYKTLSYYGL